MKLTSCCIFKSVVSGCLLITGLSLAGCAASRLTGVWSDTQYSGGPVSSVVVVGVTDNLSYRGIFEDAFAGELQKLGVKSLAGSRILTPGQVFTREEARQIIANSGYSAAIVTKVVDVQTKITETPGRVEHVYTGSSMNSRMAGLDTIDIYMPPQQTSYKVFQLETSLYDVASGKCLWSAMSEAIDPKNIDSLTASISKTVIADMQSKGLLP